MENELRKMVFVPCEDFEELRRDVKMIKESIQSQWHNNSPLGEYIPESEAGKLLSKGPTWFYNKRKSGELKGHKTGNKWYYKTSDLHKMIDEGRSNVA